MLIKIKANIPEIFLGIFLTIAVFAMGMMFESVQYQPSNNQTSAKATKIETTNKPEPFSWDWFTADGVVFFTSVLAFIAGIQAALFLWQLSYMKRGLKDAEWAAEAAKKSADATVASVELARETAIRQLRAYIMPGPCDIWNIGPNGPTNPSSYVQSQITATNRGQTPAYDITHQVKIILAAFPPPSEIFRLPEIELSKSYLAGYGDNSVAGAGIPPPDANESLALKDGYLAIYVFGEIKYTDAFKVKRESKYRFYVGGDVGFNQQRLAPMRDGNVAT